MLVAKRDPFHPGAHDNSHSAFDLGARPARVPRLARTMSALQMLGTLLAVPLGIGSAYTMYRANFSPESTCQSLRVSIVAMLDKNVDAHTRHLLARHDVETFEKSCASVDPDATAAFKALLAADAGPKPARAEAKPAEVKQPEEKPKELARKAEPAPALRKSVSAEPKPDMNEAAVSDTAWLAAVRGALAARETEAKPAKTEPNAPVSIAAPPEPAAAPPAAAAAPPLPPPASVATVPAPMPDPDHPVPPALIPNQAVK